MGLVLHVLEQHQTERHVANARKAHEGRRTGDGAHVSGPGAQVARGVDQTQKLVGQRDILEDLVGQTVEIFGFRIGHPLNACHRIRQRREVAFVAHAAQQEIEGRTADGGVGFDRDPGGWL